MPVYSSSSVTVSLGKPILAISCTWGGRERARKTLVQNGSTAGLSFQVKRKEKKKSKQDIIIILPGI